MPLGGREDGPGQPDGALAGPVADEAVRLLVRCRLDGREAEVGAELGEALEDGDALGCHNAMTS